MLRHGRMGRNSRGIIPQGRKMAVGCICGRMGPNTKGNGNKIGLKDKGRMFGPIRGSIPVHG